MNKYIRVSKRLEIVFLFTLACCGGLMSIEYTVNISKSTHTQEYRKKKKKKT